MSETNTTEQLDKLDISIDNLDVLSQLSNKPNYKLSVDNVATLILSGINNQAQLARMLGVSPQAINQYIHRHADDLRILIDNTDSIMAIKYKYQAMRYLDSIDNSTIQKASLLQRVTAAGISTDKYRLLSGQSTENISVKVSEAEMSTLRDIAKDAALRVIQAQDVVTEDNHNQEDQVSD
jgi:predicted transcriptional regulator